MLTESRLALNPPEVLVRPRLDPDLKTEDMKLTGSGRDGANNTSEFSGIVTVTALRNVTGTIYHDSNDNGSFDASEQGIGTVWVKLVQGGSVLQVKISPVPQVQDIRSRLTSADADSRATVSGSSSGVHPPVEKL